MAIESYKELIVWKKAMTLAKLTYALTAKLPASEVYGLCSQMRRCAVFIPSNIAEGYKRRNRKEYLQFLHIAQGSAAELDTQMLLASDFYQRIDFTEAGALLEEVQKMLTALIKKLAA